MFIADPLDSPRHPNRARRAVTALVKPGDDGTLIAEAAVSEANEQLVTVQVYVSRVDGATLVDIDTSEPGQKVRVNVNDGLAYRTDDSGNDSPTPREELAALVRDAFGGDWRAVSSIVAEHVPEVAATPAAEG